MKGAFGGRAVQVTGGLEYGLSGLLRITAIDRCPRIPHPIPGAAADRLVAGPAFLVLTDSLLG